jgi:hypothetical protein
MRTYIAVLESLEPRRLLASTSTISGVVFNDANSDGRRQTTEAGSAGQRVFLDANFDGKLQRGERSALTNAKGEYSFGGLGFGIYRVALVVPTNARRTTPSQGFYDLAIDGTNVQAGKNFGVTTSAIVRGNVFRDSDGDGGRDVIEPGVSRVRVFIDKNNDGKWDSKREKSRFSDSNGNYRFEGLGAGTYVLRIVVPSGMRVTAPARGLHSFKLTAGQSLSNRNFGVV